ncbi:siderophore-interacting protein [Nocardia sp. NPDC049149]|uniref:siderophore-interacting protein n=1 Tax=Nocardia sp. NPDC049149 TaxID=3364315 RepID=UPI0037133575
MNHVRTPDLDTVSLVLHPLHPRTLEVLDSQRLTPRMQRIVLGGAELEADFPFVPMAPDDHLKLFFPDPATGELIMPVMGPTGMQPRPDGRRPEFRDYTIRAFDAEKRALTIDFVLHTHGVGGTWAATARPGDRIGAVGPRGSHIYPVGYDSYLLVADETALPALSRWLEELPVGKEVIALIEVRDAADEIALPEWARVRYLHRNDAAPGTTTLLADAVRALEPPSGRLFAWAAGEADSLKPIRRYLVDALKLPKTQLKIDGYWRRGTVNLDHHAEEDN